MSLHTLANHVQSAGRGEDKVLVHMTPSEVHGLQSLAKAHGGSLTINPETGLAEAGFLSSILPMVAGFGLTALTGGVINPMTIGLITGGAGALATGSLSKGLMMGLGAYGGAGLAGMAGLGAAAAPAASAGVSSVVPPAAGTAFTAPTISPTVAGMPPTAGTAFTSAYPSPYTISGVPAGTTAATTAGTAATANPILNPTPVATANATPSAMTGKLGADFKTLTNDFSMKNAGAFVKEHPLVTAGALGLGYSALNPPKNPELKKSEANIRPYDNSSFQVNPDVEYYQPYSGASTAERDYFTGGLKALPIQKVAEGGLTNLAVGGPVETMSAENAVGQNMGYPQARLETSMYSNPMVQRPTPSAVINQGVDTNVDRYSGEERMAGGGSVSPNGKGVGGSGLGGMGSPIIKALQSRNEGYTYDYNPNTQQFTQLSSPQLVQQNNNGSVAQMNGLNSTNYRRQDQQPFTPVVTGGIAQPMQQAAPIQQPMQRPMQQGNVPAYQTPEQQLGLEGFYNNMQQQLASYAEGGYTRSAPLNSKMAAVDAARAKMQTRQGQMEMEKAARDGDYSAQLALKDYGYDLNDLNKYATGGGVSHLGDYSDGGRLLRGPGDGVSDSIPASIGNRQPARLADGEFVIPARIVSEIGNGSTEAGARKLYAMMNRVQGARKKTVGKNQVAKNTKAERLLPA